MDIPPTPTADIPHSSQLRFRIFSVSTIETILPTDDEDGREESSIWSAVFHRCLGRLYLHSRHFISGVVKHLNSQIVLSKTQFDINETKFLASSDILDAPTCERWESSPIGLALLGKKRKFEPEADEDDEQILHPSKRAKTKGLPSNKENKETFDVCTLPVLAARPSPFKRLWTAGAPLGVST